VSRSAATSAAGYGKIRRVSDGGGKRVSWVELYLDLIFVLAVGQLSHLIVGEPETRSVWIALGLFFTLWWTWVGFAVVYNRFGSDTPAQRLLFLAGSVPAGVAAVAIEPASTGKVTVFALSMAITRLLLGFANGYGGGWRELLSGRIAVTYGISAALFLVSIWVPEPLRYVLWAIGIGQESGAMLREDRRATRRPRGERDWSALKPANPDEALDPHHFAERFGLFLIILLGEVVVEAGQASVDGHVATFDGWMALVAAMILAAALWWLYFDAAADLNLRVFELSGGSPTMARAIFAVGHMLPSFSLLLVAAGVGLLLEEDPPAIAYAMPAIGIGIYLLTTRVFMSAKTHGARALRLLLVIAIFNLGRLHETLEPHAYLWLLSAIAVVCAALSMRRATQEDMDQMREDRRRRRSTSEL
jgi:low temperature requirement protein LtrA